MVKMAKALSGDDARLNISHAIGDESSEQTYNTVAKKRLNVLTTLRLTKNT